MALPTTDLAAPGVAKVRRVLLVSRLFPSDFESGVYGILQRLRLFLEAGASTARSLDVLFFAEPEFLQKLDASVYAAAMRDAWGVDANVTFALRRTGPRSRLVATLGPIIDARHHADLCKLANEEQAASIAACVRSDTDLIIAFLLDAGLAVMAMPNRTVPFVLDLNDIMYRALGRRLLQPPWRLLPLLAWPALYLGERRAIRTAAAAFVCSEADRAGLQKTEKRGRIRVAPNAARFPSVPPDRSSSRSNDLLLIGTFGYDPNFEAARWMISEIFPQILAEVPTARLILVGGSIERLAPLANLSPNVVMRGFVPSLEEVYRDTAISCCPIRGGGGTRTKIIEAASYAVPVVSTVIGAEGIEFEDSSEIVLCEKADAFAAACIRLLNDRASAEAIGKASFIKARRLYSKTVAVQAIADACLAVAARAAP